MDLYFDDKIVLSNSSFLLVEKPKQLWRTSDADRRKWEVHVSWSGTFDFGTLARGTWNFGHWDFETFLTEKMWSTCLEPVEMLF